MAKWVAEKLDDKTVFFAGVSKKKVHKDTLTEVRKVLSQGVHDGKCNWEDIFKVTLFDKKILDAWRLIVREQDQKPRCKYIVTKDWIFKKEGKENFLRLCNTGWDTPLKHLKDFTILSQTDSFEELQRILLVMRDTHGMAVQNHIEKLGEL